MQQQRKEIAAPELFETIAQAIALKLAIHFDYLKPAEDVCQARKVEPYLLYYSDSIWYAVCYDLKDGIWKKFALSRMRKASILPLDAVHGTSKEAKRMCRQGMGPFFTGKTQRILLWMDKKAAWYAAQTPWHSSQVIKTQGDASALVSLEVSGLQDLTRKVMEWCPHVIVVEPATLKDEIEKQLKVALLHYRTLVVKKAHPAKAQRAGISSQNLRRRDVPLMSNRSSKSRAKA